VAHRADLILALESLYVLPNPELGYRSIAGLLAGDRALAVATHPRRENHFVHALMNRDLQRASSCVAQPMGSDRLTGDPTVEFDFHWLDHETRKQLHVLTGLRAIRTDTISGHWNLLERLERETEHELGFVDESSLSNPAISIPRVDIEVLQLDPH